MFEFELEFLKTLENVRTEFLNNLFEAVTIVGEETILIVILMVLYFMVNKDLAKKVLYIVTTSSCINGIVKNIVKMPRPWTMGEVTCVREETATGYSFPSGHTQNTATWTTTFAIILKKHWVTILTIFTILLVGFSRMFLGAHYPSDVIVGTILGVLIAFLGSFLYDKVKDKNKLILITILLMLPFVIYFLMKPEALFADFFKIYGVLVAFYLTNILDDKIIKFDTNQVLWKKFIRLIVVIVLALLIKGGLKVLFGTFMISSIIWCSLLLDAIRYFLLLFIILGICPMVFKKINL